MSAGLHINHTSFGRSSDLGDVLILELSPDGLDLCEFNNSLNQPLYTAHYDLDAASALSVKEQLISAIRHFNPAQKKYQSVFVNYFTELFTLCPAAFYDPDHKRQLLEFNAGTSGDCIILHDDINQEIKLVYAVDEQLKSALDLLFPNHHMKHSLCVLAQLMLHSEELAKDQVLVNVHPSHMELVIKQDGKLLLANQFAVRSQEDVLYYILFALEQYQHNPATVSLCMTGNTDSHSELMLTLKKYIRHLHLGTGHRSINWQGVEGMPQHFNYSLINRVFCES